MKCQVYKDERWPSMGLDKIGSKAKDPHLVDVPPKLINAVQKAEVALAAAELDVLEHLHATGQFKGSLRGSESWLASAREYVGRSD